MSLKGTTQSFSILRGEGDDAMLEAYDLELDEGMVVLDCIHRIQHEQEPDMAVRWNCKAGKCGSCSAEINGRPRLMCMTRMSDVVAETPAGQPIEIRPMKAFPHVKDLVTDVSWNYEVAQRIAPINGPETMDWEFNQMEADRVQHFRECIECFLCVNTCHVLRDHALFDDFAGPRNLVRLAQYEMHPLIRRTEFLKSRKNSVLSTAILRDAAPRFVLLASKLPTMPSSNSKSAWLTDTTTRCNEFGGPLRERTFAIELSPER